MYIVQPSWLATIKIIPPGIAIVIGTKMDEPGFRFSSPKLHHRWPVTPGRIQVETERPDENCGEKVAAVLQALPWTPLAALGNNTTYVAPLMEFSSLPDEMRRCPEAPTGYQLTQRSHHFAAGQDSRTFNIRLSITREAGVMPIRNVAALDDACSPASLRLSSELAAISACTILLH